MANLILKYRGPIEFKPERQPDGKWAIRGVPIFECHVSDDPNYCAKVDPAWMYAAIKDQQDLKARGFYPRLFIGHTDDSGREKPIIGKLDNYRFDPADQWLYADYVDIEEADVPLLKKFPGRSVEASKGKPAIRGVALLGATPPYFKLPDVKFADGEEIARYSLEIPMAIDNKTSESNASSQISPEEKADYQKFCKYMKAYEAEKTASAPAPENKVKEPEKFGATGNKAHDAKLAGTREWDEENGEPGPPSYKDNVAVAKYAELVEHNRTQAARINALEEASERANWRAKYAEAHIPAGRINVDAKLDLLMKMPDKATREAFYQDSLTGIVAPPAKRLDPKDTAPASKPDPGTQEEAEAVQAKYQEWKSKGVVKNYAEAQAKYIREER